MAAAAAELRRRTQPRPAGPPRTAAQPRPAAQRPADPRSASQQPVPPRPATRDPRPVSTGQVPVARTRATAAGPTGTAQLPVLRQDPPAPTRDPARRRLREEPQPVGAPEPALRPRAAEPALRHEPAARAGSPVPAPRPVIRTVPPPPAAADPEPPTARRRRPLRQAFAVLAALGLISIHALPSIAAAEAPPVAGIHQDDDLQQFQVGEVDASGARMDGVSGDMPVVAPTWVVPMKGELRDGFGPRLQQPVAGVSLFHRGQDIGGGCGAPIHVAAAGVVETTGWWGTYGNWTLVQHGDGIETGYAHQARIIVRPGQHVAANQVIGYEGNTGASTGCHLHLEVHINGVAVNPVPFFKAKGIPLGQ